MKLVPLDQLVVPPNRVRREFNPHAEIALAESIRDRGLFHPPLLRADGRTVIAGERRIRARRGPILADRAIRFDGMEVPVGFIPCVVADEADAAGYLEAELHENLRRRQLTWQEQAIGTAALHKLRKAQNPAQTATDTYREIVQQPDKEVTSGDSFAMINDDLLVADHLDDEEVLAAPNRKEAVKIITQRKETARRKKLADEFGVIAGSGNATLLRGNCLEIIPTLPEASFDLLIADPPYGVNAGEWANQSAVQHAYTDTLKESNELYTFFAGEACQRVLKREAHAYLFCDSRRFEEVSGIFSASGWRVWPWPLIYFRGAHNGIVPWPYHGPRRTFECICFAILGDRRATGVYPDVLAHTHDSTVEFGAHKPVELYRDLIRRSCSPGDKVLDPCAGSGPVLDAAKRENVFVTAIELDDAAYGLATERLRK